MLCLTSLPLALIGLIGISGESLTSFLAIFLRYLRNRRVVGGDGEAVQGEREKAGGESYIRSSVRKLFRRGKSPAPESVQEAVRTAKEEKEDGAEYPDGGVPGKRIFRKSLTR